MKYDEVGPVLNYFIQVGIDGPHDLSADLKDLDRQISSQTFPSPDEGTKKRFKIDCTSRIFVYKP